MLDNIRHLTISTNGINLHCVEAGPEDGDPLILLHGFPEFWYGWNKQIPVLAAAGYRVLAPDQRGYNLSDKPKDIAAYNFDQGSKDLLGLIDWLGVERVNLVGHDWGGAVSWWTANKYPERFKKMVILNVPHHRAFSGQLRTNPAQRRRSWYMQFFQLPILPEIVVRAGMGARMMGKGNKNSPFTKDDFARYAEAWAQPGAMRGMINWYRALTRARATPPENYEIQVPTLLIWGKNDLAFVPELAQLSIEYCQDGRLVEFDDATHWVQHDKPDRVNSLILEFFSEA